jgi:lipoprotein-anchoring transpeptidase ErfK/SrfK
VVARVPRTTVFGSDAVLAVVRRRGWWLGVVDAALGNGRVGWVRQQRVRVLREQWSIDVDLSRRRAVLALVGRRYRSFPVAVGTSAYPTPTGRFGVTDRLTTGGAGSVYGCCALALSATQPHVAQDWPGGDRIAIHGTDEPASIGTAASHGCLRATEAAMRLLIAKVPLGTPVTVHE